MLLKGCPISFKLKSIQIILLRLFLRFFGFNLKVIQANFPWNKILLVYLEGILLILKIISKHTVAWVLHKIFAEIYQLWIKYG